MNNAQLDMVLGYLNEGTEIDTIDFILESLNEEINSMMLEDVEVVNEGATIDKIKDLIANLIEKFKNFLKFIKEKVLVFIGTIKKAILKILSKSKTTDTDEKTLEYEMLDFPKIENYISKMYDMMNGKIEADKNNVHTDADNVITSEYTIQEFCKKYSEDLNKFENLNKKLCKLSNDALKEFDKLNDEIRKIEKSGNQVPDELNKKCKAMVLIDTYIVMISRIGVGRFKENYDKITKYVPEGELKKIDPEATKFVNMNKKSK